MPRSVLPDKLMPRVAWSLAEPVPRSADDLIERLDAYAKSIKTKVNKRELRKVFPGEKLDVEYEYAVQHRTGDWDMLRAVARVKRRRTPLTFAEILFQLHKASHRHLKNQDHHYFEGLYLLEHPLRRGIPAYEVYLGS